MMIQIGMIIKTEEAKTEVWYSEKNNKFVANWEEATIFKGGFTVSDLRDRLQEANPNNKVFTDIL